VNFHE
jgi:hypothetical protein